MNFSDFKTIKINDIEVNKLKIGSDVVWEKRTTFTLSTSHSFLSSVYPTYNAVYYSINDGEWVLMPTTIGAFTEIEEGDSIKFKVKSIGAGATYRTTLTVASLGINVSADNVGTDNKLVTTGSYYITRDTNDFYIKVTWIE